MLQMIKAQLCRAAKMLLVRLQICLRIAYICRVKQA